MSLPLLTTMRVIMCAALLAACETTSGRDPGTAFGPGIDLETSAVSSTGAAPRLDLGTDPPIPDLPAETGGTTGDTSTGEASTGASTTSTGGGDSSSGSSTSGASTTGGDSSSGSSSGDTSSSTGEPPAACGDGVCEPSERAPCWALPKEGWCFGDCWKDPACVSDCPCTPAAAAAKNWCYADPLPTCAPTAPGGYCSQPDGDIWGFYSWTAKCG